MTWSFTKSKLIIIKHIMQQWIFSFYSAYINLISSGLLMIEEVLLPLA